MNSLNVILVWDLSFSKIIAFKLDDSRIFPVTVFIFLRASVLAGAACFALFAARIESAVDFNFLGGFYALTTCTVGFSIDSTLFSSAVYPSGRPVTTSPHVSYCCFVSTSCVWLLGWPEIWSSTISWRCWGLDKGLGAGVSCDYCRGLLKLPSMFASASSSISLIGVSVFRACSVLKLRSVTWALETLPVCTGSAGATKWVEASKGFTWFLLL